MIEIKKEQNVAIFIDGQNLSRSISEKLNDKFAMIDYDKLIPKVLNGRNLSKMIFFTEGLTVSDKLRERLFDKFGAEVMACGKGADVPLVVHTLLTVFFKKIDTVIIMSGDRDFIELVKALKLMQVKVEIAAVEKHINREFALMASKFYNIKDEFYIFNPKYNINDKPNYISND